MNFHVMTLFPEMIERAMNESITGRAIKAGYISVDAVNIRDFANNKHNRVDDYPYGGGAGMVMQAEPVYRCYESICHSIGNERPRVVFMTPQVRTFNQKIAEELSQEEDLVLLCGHYEGIDARIENHVDEVISIGDYILTGGELASMVVADSVIRLLNGVILEDSINDESYENGLLEYPQYTHPAVWNGREVPDVLLSGHHQNVDAWRRQQSIKRTFERRPDMLENAELSKKDKLYLSQLKLNEKTE